jgi:hypothetical protein
LTPDRLRILPEAAPAEVVVQFRAPDKKPIRCRVVAIRTLKSVIHLGRVPVRTDQALRVHVLAKLLIALLIESLLYQGESFSPWGYPLPGSQRVAAHALPS